MVTLQKKIEMKTNTLPVSKKVYADVTARIGSSLNSCPVSAAEAMRIVNSYLAGDTVVISRDPMAMIALSMIKSELDRAMARSARARLRRKKRIEKEEVATAPSIQKSAGQIEEEIIAPRISLDDPEYTYEDEGPAPVMLSRRERRARARAAIKKARKATSRTKYA